MEEEDIALKKERFHIGSVIFFYLIGNTIMEILHG